MKSFKEGKKLKPEEMVGISGGKTLSKGEKEDFYFVHRKVSMVLNGLCSSCNGYEASTILNAYNDVRREWQKNIQDTADESANCLLSHVFQEKYPAICSKYYI